MSKRSAEIQGGKDNPGFQGEGNGWGSTMDDKKQATAAQLARRVIKRPKGTRRGVSPSPAPSGLENRNPFTASQNAPQNTGFGASAGATGSNFNFTAPSSGFSFSNPSASNPFNNANGVPGSPAATAGFQGSIFNISAQPSNTAPQIQPPSPTKNLFGQGAGSPQSNPPSNLFGGFTTQQSQPAVNMFEQSTPSQNLLGQAANSQQPKPTVNLFGGLAAQQSQPSVNLFERSTPSQAQSSLGSPTDSMQTSPDNTPAKTSAKPSLFNLGSTATSSQPLNFPSRPDPSTTENGTSEQSGAATNSSAQPQLFNPFASATQPASVAQPLKPNLFNLAPTTNSDPPAQAAKPNLFNSPSTTVSDTPDKGPEPNIFNPTSTNNLNSQPQPSMPNMFNPTSSTSLTSPTASPKPDLFNPFSPTPNSSTASNFGSSILKKKTSAPMGKEESSDKVGDVPSRFTDGQKREYVTQYRLRSLNSEVKKLLAEAPIHADFGDLFLSYIGIRDKVLHGEGLPADAIAGLKRKATQPLENGVFDNGKKARVEQQPIPAINKRKADDETTKSNANGNMDSGKKSKNGDHIAYPSLPTASEAQSGSQTSNIFKNILNGSKLNASPKPSNGAPASSAESTKSSSDASSFKVPAFSAESTKVASNTPAFKSPVPSTESAKTSSGASGFKPPIFSTGPVNFMAQFGKAANESAEKEKAKRKAEDFDSDEDDEAEWERKDAEAQEEKRRKAAELVKQKSAKFIPGKGFVIEEEAEKSEKEAPKSNLFGSLQSPSKEAPKSNMFGSLQSPTKEAPKSNMFGSLENPAPAAPSASMAASSEGPTNEDPKASPFASQKSPTNAASTSNIFAPSTGPTNDTPKANPFASLNGPAGDQTWKPESPIKFGSIQTPAKPTNSDGKDTPNPFGNLFASPQNPSTETPPKPPTSNLFGSATSSPTIGFSFGGPKSPSNETPSKPPHSNLVGSTSKTPNIGFSFGGPPKNSATSLFAPSTNTSASTSASESRANSPGTTTENGESANESAADGATGNSTADENAEGDNAAQNSKQINLASSGPGEENEDVVFEVRAKAMLYEEKEGSDKKSWTNKGVGPFRVLRHRETGKHRILLRQDPSGKVVINAAVLSGVDYKYQATKSVILQTANSERKFSLWALKVGKDDDAHKLAELLEECKTKKG
ncbi:MAG: hypothetical protein M1819_000754 [Sarea resinae]|nr:MAG: hypothetical protein M1819_000754 [Sarea resinae]